MKAVLIAEECGNRSRSWNVGETNYIIRDWWKAKAAGAWQKTVKGKCNIGCGHRAMKMRILWSKIFRTKTRGPNWGGGVRLIIGEIRYT